MMSGNQPDWLPPNWIEVKDNFGGEVMYYRNTETGQTSFSKEDVIRYINMGNISNTPPQLVSEYYDQIDEDNEPVGEEHEVHAETNTVIENSIIIPEWLPRGWTMELRSQNGGRLCKCYVHPESGRRFYSKPQVFRYLEALNSSSATQEGEYIDSPNVICETREESFQEPESFKRDGIPSRLPEGWTTEVKVRGNGRKTKIFIAPESGRKFYCLPAVFDYLKTLNSCPARQERPDVICETGEKSFQEPDSLKRERIPLQLPEGWTTEVKVRGNGRKTKIFIDPESGRKFYCLPAVSAYLKTLNSGPARQERPDVICETGEKSVQQPESFKRERIPLQLPEGWTTEVKVRGNGRKTKIFIDPESGRKFYCLPAVSDYLKTLNSCPAKQEKVQNGVDQSSGDRCSSEPNRLKSEEHKSIGIKRGTSKPYKVGGSSLTEKVIERGPADELPAGWIREIRVRKNGKRDPFFIDPSSGYRFFSKRDALRYIETGNIKSCVIKPRLEVVNDTSDANNLKSIDGDILINKELVNDTGNANDTKSINEDILVTDRASVDGLPPGWIREDRSKKSASGTKKRSYYIDPSSSYEFHSKRDALRYHETGDIKKCIVRPTRRDINGTESAYEDNDPRSATGKQELGQVPISNKLSTGGLTAADSESSKGRQNNSVSADAIAASENHTNGTRKSGMLTPGRSSKRLKGAEPEMMGVPLQTKRVLRSTARGKQMEAEPEREKSKGEKPQGSGMMFPLGDSSSSGLDTCLEFAVKTLTGNTI